MTRDEYRRQTIKTRRWSKFWLGLKFFVCLPLLLPIFLGDIFSFPFVARRHESFFRWSLYMFAQSLAPAIIIGTCIGYLLVLAMRRWH
ncbi:hypothetical protein DES53_102891 [Roseimicrobium gellanilyticum]|uniref:Uncharacterized protein n=1 Tax=Roseimicrobium gellanilyticum TaxID=748857 RepID=A0A366HS39_9BACT|nr:hypothetical protein DES53_102891 [Roseimicrobium gellanilyticum]